MKLSRVFAIENQQNRLITLEVMANRVFEKMTKWPPKTTFFDFGTSKVSISTNSDPYITNLIIFVNLISIFRKENNNKKIR